MGKILFCLVTVLDKGKHLMDIIHIIWSHWFQSFQLVYPVMFPCFAMFTSWYQIKAFASTVEMFLVNIHIVYI